MISEIDLKYLKLAEEMANCSDYPRVHIGACIVKNKSVVSTGCNKNKTHPEQRRYNSLLPYKMNLDRLHAEMDALIKAGEDAKGATLYVFRKRNDGKMGNCKPCASCMGKILNSKISRVVYTTETYNGEIDIRVIRS